MAGLQSIVVGDDEPGGDGMALTLLVDRMVKRIPMLCTLKTFYDGQEVIPSKSIPKSVNMKGYAVYQRFLDVCSMDFAKAIADAVIHRQRPTGFRLIADRTMRSTAADDEWDLNRMELKSRQMFHDYSVYGAAYAMIDGADEHNRIKVLSPWTCAVSDDDDSAVYYWYSEADSMECLTLYRLIRNPDGSVKTVYCRNARREVQKRTLYFEEDAEDIYELANDDSKQPPSLQPVFEWVEDHPNSKGLEFAAECGCLPVVRMGAPGGKGQFEPHVRALSGIDQQRFQRFCIQELQAFKQRAVSIDNLQMTYKETDPQVMYGQANAGDPVDFSQMFEQGPDALWLVPGDAKFWESSPVDVSSLVNAVAADVKQLAASSGTPLDILSPDVAGSAEGASLKREGLVFKVEDANARANDAFVRLMRMALVADKHKDAADDRFETVWKPINPPSALEQAQAANYSKGILPVKTNMRRNYGMTEIEIAEAMQDLMDSQFQQAMATENALLDGKAVEQSPAVLPDETGMGSNQTIVDTTAASFDPDTTEQSDTTGETNAGAGSDVTL